MDYSLTPCTKVNSKWIKDVNVRLETIKPLEENRGRKTEAGCFLTSVLVIFFLDMSPQARETKAKINKCNYIKLKSFCTVKETINKTKRQPTDWEKIFANDTPDKGLIYKIFKELKQLKIKKKMNRDFPGGAVVKNPPANAGDTGSSPAPTCHRATKPVHHNY